MSEEKLDVASEFADLTGTEIEVAHESESNVNNEDAQLESNVIDLTEDASETEQVKSPLELAIENESSKEVTESSLKSDSRTEEREPEVTPESQEVVEEEYYPEEQEYRESSSEDAYYNTLDMLNETYNTDYDNLDDLLDDLESENGEGFANEQLEEINRFVSETGRSAEDYFRTQTQNYDEMSDDGVIKEYLALENPELTQKEIDLFYNSTYKQDDKYSSEENQLGKIHLKKDVIKAREELKELQQEYWSPEPTSDEYTDEEIRQIQMQQDEAREDFYDQMDDELDSIESLTFQINDKESFDYKLTDEDKQVVGQALSNLDDFFEPYMDEQGNMDRESLALDMMAMKLQGKIVKSVASQYRSKGSEQVLRDIKNPSYEPAKMSDRRSNNSIEKQISGQIFGDSTLWD
tara:strand:- start:131 stop:1354 length:1224 start_codon:yes stop_codon:yes gene_type:complete